MNKLIEWLKGKKTYITAIIIGILAALNSLGVVVPEWVYLLISAAGLGAVRSAIKRASLML
jgi:hypothetical protein